MADLVVLSDFTGNVFLQNDVNTEAKFDDIRDEYARPLIRKMLGTTLGNLFLTNFDDNAGVPTGVYATIYEPFSEDYGGCVIESKGIKYIVKQTIWFYFARQNNIIVSAAGNKSSTSQNSSPSTDNFYLAKEYNAGVRNIRAIQDYICRNSSDYPDYNGQEFDFISLGAL